MSRACEDCAADITLRHHLAVLCPSCAKVRIRACQREFARAKRAEQRKPRFCQDCPAEVFRTALRCAACDSEHRIRYQKEYTKARAAACSERHFYRQALKLAQRKCGICGGSLKGRHGLTKYCDCCADQQQRVYYKRYRRSHRVARDVYAHRRRARLSGLPATLTKQEWARIYDAFDGVCAYCPREARTVDHVVPVVMGGGTTADNVVPCCRSCNSAKGAKDVDSWHMPGTRRAIVEYLSEALAQ